MFRSSVLVLVLAVSADGLGTKAKNPWCHNGHLEPSIFMLGMQKAGSTSLWQNLIEKLPVSRGCGEVGVPCTVMGQQEPLWYKKELHFFDDKERYSKGMDFYAAHFPKCTEVAANQRAIDGTPNYFTDGTVVAERIAESYGESKKDLHFILVVRSPVKRMEAGYYHFMNGQAGGFDDFVDKTIEPAAAWANETSKSAPSSPNPYHGSLYGKFLQQYLQVFDGSQFSVVTLEQYSKAPEKVMNFLANRLKLKQKSKLDAAVHKLKVEHPHMNLKTQDKLDKFFGEDQVVFDSLVKKHCMAMDCGSAHSDM